MRAYTWACTGCGVEKPPTAFPMLPGSRTRSHRCRQCGPTAERSPCVVPDDAQMREMAREGKTLSEAAQLLGWSRRTVRERADRAGVKFKGPHWTTDEDARLRECVAAGMCRHRVARCLQRAEASVDERVRQLRVRIEMTSDEWSVAARGTRWLLCSECGERKHERQFSERQARKLDHHDAGSRSCASCEAIAAGAVERVTFDAPDDYWGDEVPIGARR